MPDSSSNPFQAPQSFAGPPRTFRNLTPLQCLACYLAVGLMTGVIGGLWAVSVNGIGLAIGVMLFVPGVLYGVGFWATTHYCIGAVSRERVMLLIVGCLLGFIVTGVVYESTLPIPGFMGPPWTWERLRPCVFGPAAGTLLISAVLRLAGGHVQWRVIVAVWLAGTALGFTAFVGFHELERKVVSQTMAVFLGVLWFQATMMGLTGWQLATARAAAEQSIEDRAGEAASEPLSPS